MDDAPNPLPPGADAPPPKKHEEGSIAELLSRLVDDAESFVRAEIKLYRVELLNKVNLYRSLLALAAFGALLALGSVTLLLIAAVFALSPYLGAAWSALIVAVIAMVLAGALIGTVISRIRKDLGGDEEDAG